ncbi:hypothetical protein AVEN_58435-1 [Araneus ventricosus]|uniref:Uncharacterized protein n=1 Tax=Araneus ventricosus TaxID=182803 RepID=A0A4Y2IR10_ARAVE|nr:hypothetical protein AVEN_58435-1 [Araneus ventricosus]
MANRTPASVFELLQAGIQFHPDITAGRTISLIISARRLFLLAPLKPAVLGRKQYELESSNLGGHLLHHSPPAITFPQGTEKWALLGVENWPPAALIS